jgi:DNA-binding NarL/FixJ family response regulator
VVVVDDTEDIRALMKLGLERYGIEVRGEASDGATAADVVRETKPDIVLLDLHMPEVGGLEAMPVILEAHPRCRVVVYSAISATRMTGAAFDAGAHGYIVKGVSPRRIAEHLRRVNTAGAVRPVHPYPLAGGGD